jgi:hypothetical protein
VDVPPAAWTRQLRAIECISSQLHWRRRELCAFAGTSQWFEPPDTATALRQPHRVQSAWIVGNRLVVDFVRGRWPSLGPLELKVSCDNANGRLERLTIPLPGHAGVFEVPPGAGGPDPAHGRLSRLGDHWRIEVPLASPVLPERTFVKIERPRELALGFFDKSGWWPVTPSTERDPFHESPLRRAPLILGSKQTPSHRPRSRS